MEIPTGLLGDLTRFTHLDFVLAHRVLEDPEYRAFYALRPHNRVLILDNSMHELGAPLPLSDIANAAKMVNALYVIPPDKLGEPEWNLEQVGEMRRFFEPWRIAPVLAGRTASERRSYYSQIAPVPMLCLPFREPRLEWFLELFEREDDLPPRIHLLGMTELSEARSWTWIARRLEARTIFTFDTAKPIKWGLHHRFIDDGGSLRGAPISSKELLDVRTITPEQRDYIQRNIECLVRALGVS
jgi:hypothetical protein